MVQDECVKLEDVSRESQSKDISHATCTKHIVGIIRSLDQSRLFSFAVMPTYSAEKKKQAEK